jgi:hypothetical protein
MFFKSIYMSSGNSIKISRFITEKSSSFSLPPKKSKSLAFLKLNENNCSWLTFLFSLFVITFFLKKNCSSP